MMARMLVTGVAGFIGSSLAESLIADNHTVTGVDCFTDYYPRTYKERNLAALLKDSRFTFIEKPIEALDLASLVAAHDTIFHLAAQPGVRASWGREFEVYTSLNILATQKLLEASVNSSIHRFVYASSSSVYGDTHKLPSSEDDPICPLSPYGVSKLAGEHLARLYHANHGVPTASLRYFTVYGPRQRPDMAFHRFLRAIFKNEKITLYGDGAQTRDFTFIRDVVAATRAAGERGTPGGVYNVGGGHRVSLNDVFDCMAEITGRAISIDRQGKVKGDVRHTWADTTRARTDLGFAPATKLREGLEEEYRWIRDVYAS